MELFREPEKYAPLAEGGERSGGWADSGQRLAALQKELRQAGRARSAETKTQPAEDRQYRFSATRLAAHRKKLGLSAADYGRPVGMSGASVYLWEQGQVRPRPEQVRQLGALKQLSRRAALERLASAE